MRKAVKNPSSDIILKNLQYITNNTNNNKKIANILLHEQKNFCSYTDEHISRSDTGDIEHFDPTLKKTPQDNYNNWFVVKHQWNIEKSNKWNNYQPILHPTAHDFEDRIIYKDGDYFASSDLDVEAKNLISLLQLDNLALAEKRKKYIKRARDLMQRYGEPSSVYFSILIANDINQLSYLRAIKEEFGIDLWAILP